MPLLLAKEWGVPPWKVAGEGTPLIWSIRWGEWQSVANRHAESRTPQSEHNVASALENYGI